MSTTITQDQRGWFYSVTDGGAPVCLSASAELRIRPRPPVAPMVPLLTDGVYTAQGRAPRYALAAKTAVILNRRGTDMSAAEALSMAAR